MQKRSIDFGSCAVGVVPRVVGIVSRLETVPRVLADSDPGCELVEFRLDRIGVEQADWEPVIDQVEAAGYPVIATLRIPEEGGEWQGEETVRKPYFLRALEGAACIDVEWRSALFDELAHAALTRGKAVIASYHDYEKTPPLDELRHVIQRAARYENVVAKIAVRVQSRTDSDRLRALLAESHPAPVCLIGMGDLGTPTRIEFPRLGSCLAYGHLDESTAPGQLSCREIASQIHC